MIMAASTLWPGHTLWYSGYYFTVLLKTENSLPVPRLITDPSSVGDVFMIIAANTLRPDILSGIVAASVLKAWCDMAAILSKNVAFKPNSASLAAWKIQSK